MRLAPLLLSGGLLLGCGSPPAPAFVREDEQAALAQRKGQHQAAAQHYERAAKLADKPRDAEEARYRAADSYERAGSFDQARAIYRELAAQSGGERQARADFALAELELHAGHEAAGQALLVRALRQHPDSGVARSALTSHLSYLRAQGGSAATLAYLEGERRALAASELAETLEYHYARELDDAGRATEARDAYLACARRFTYPSGAYWDDALYRAAQKELELGAPRAALELLSRLLVEQEDAHLNGSYQRSRYAEAQLLKAEIYRDQLADPVRARSELRKLWLKHPQSRLVDDALFQEALLARAAQDSAGTCAPLQIIVSQLPDSRYAPCAHLLCASLPAPAGRECHDYVKRAAGLP